MFLKENPTLADQIEKEIRASFSGVKPDESAETKPPVKEKELAKAGKGGK